MKLLLEHYVETENYVNVYECEELICLTSVLSIIY